MRDYTLASSWARDSVSCALVESVLSFPQLAGDLGLLLAQLGWLLWLVVEEQLIDEVVVAVLPLLVLAPALDVGSSLAELANA